MAGGIRRGGRQRGVQNKLTAQMKLDLQAILLPELKTLPERLKNMNDKEWVDAKSKLMPYAFHKYDKDINYNEEVIEQNVTTVGKKKSK